MSPLLPDQANRLLCDELKEADTKDMMAVAKRFPCKDRLKQASCLLWMVDCVYVQRHE